MSINMENLTALDQDLKEKREADAANNNDNFNAEINMTLTEEEETTLQQIKDAYEGTSVMVNDTDAEGHTVPIPVQEYTKTLDKNVVLVGGKDHPIKSLNLDDITQTTAEMKEEARQRSLAAIKQFAAAAKKDTDEKALTDEEYMDINNAALIAIQKYLDVDRLDSNEVVKKLSKLPLSEICKILPDEFVSIYTTPNEIKVQNIKAKDRILSTIAYLTAIGPEMDYLNEYIDNQNKLVMVSKRLLECQVNFSEMIKSEDTMAELIARAHEISPKDESIWSKYIKLPDRLHNEFAQRVVIYEEYEKAYRELLTEYTDKDSQDLINGEIEAAQQYQEVFRHICDLTMIRELEAILEERFRSNKKCSMRYLLQEAEEAVDKVRRCKQNLSFPGYKGDERKANHILTNYLKYWPIMINKYNNTLAEIITKSEITDEELGDIEKIHLDGYKETDVSMVFGILMVILMGRILKRCTRNDATRYEAITLDSYFQLFCKIGTDIYIMRDIWNMMKGFVKYTLDTWYLPEYNKNKTK